MAKKLNIAGYYWDGTISWIIYEDEHGNNTLKKNDQKSNS